MEAAAAKLMDMSQPFDLALLDQVVTATYDPHNPQQQQANRLLMQLKDHKEMWTRSKDILEGNASPQTKFFGLQILDDVVQTQWKALPQVQREGIRNFVSGMIVSLSQSDEMMAQNRVLLGKLDRVLVGVLKQEWPHNWPSFVPDIVALSKTSEVICENNMQILKLLSEEVFDFGKESMTAAKITTMKASLEGEFAKIYELCDFVLARSVRVALLNVTLQTLQRFITWIPVDYVFNTSLIATLTTKFFPAPAFRVSALECLTEVGVLNNLPARYDPFFRNMFIGVMEQLVKLMPADVDLVRAYPDLSEAEQMFVKKLALFFTGFLRPHLSTLEVPEGMAALLEGLSYVVRISEVPDDEVFKICLEYYHALSQDLYQSDSAFRPAGGLAGGLAVPADPRAGGRTAAYKGILSRIRHVLIMRMSKPEEVLIVEDENGEIVRETTRDTEAIAQYKTMRETLVYLTHLHYEDTESIMLNKLCLQVDGREFSWNNLNTLCWAIGSISGAMSEEEEKRFLVTVIKDLLNLCEMKRGKDNKAVIASNIMYVVGQYPRFLRAHWKFLRTVVNKLFEFMHETHPGVQDMACDTFLKIAQKCKRKFVVTQVGEQMPFIEELLQQLPTIVSDLETHQVHTFYEAVACMLSDRGTVVAVDRPAALQRLMAMPNARWRDIFARAQAQPDTILLPETVKDVTKILRTNVRVCDAAGPLFSTQLTGFFHDMLTIYKCYSENISQAVAQQGELATRMAPVRAMRGAKKEVLQLLTVFIERSGEPESPPQAVAQNLIPPMLDPILGDYQRNIAGARDPEVLSLFATAISVLKEQMAPFVARIMEAVFECTLMMITQNMEDFPEHRIKFFQFLKAVNTHCFGSLFEIPPAHQKLVVDAVVWAFKHTERNIAETGLDILLELLQNVGRAPAVAQGFYQQYLLSLIQDILAVMTDMLHKSCFKAHATLLRHMFHLTQAGQVTVQLWNEQQAAAAAATGRPLPPGAEGNKQFLAEYVCDMLLQSFPQNLTRANAVEFVRGLFDERMELNAFKQHLRDFLITIKEFSPEESQELFYEETQANKATADQALLQARLAVPGLVNPHERPEEDMGDL
eukprot:TRINITY_DN8353_c0_g1_i1.p1 TRINITY_DN8353_c0_g1~~TRINITY_DN8353_c0_g1_i1.p1  ORF type:complete len:1092 (+),score=466.29 TRINITY_DN8353_c0_g1_i1:336-3611(+)